MSGGGWFTFRARIEVGRKDKAVRSTEIKKNHWIDVEQEEHLRIFAN